MIDLHAHTTASDGSLAPTALVRLAAQTGLSTIAVTDHDTVGGCAEAIAAAPVAGVEVVPGIEISVDYPQGEFHLLGYFIDYEDRSFLAALHRLQDNRLNRNHQMIAKMQAAGLPITMEDVIAEAGGGQIGRPHMAKALLRRGVVASVQEAFDRYLADGAPCHVPKIKLGPEAAIALIHAAGGVAILAHPKYLEFPDPPSLERAVAAWRDAGLDGIECYYSQHSEAETAAYLETARRLRLLVSGGSDFHGDSKPDVKLGGIYRGRPLPADLLPPIRARAAGRRAVNMRSGCAHRSG